MTVLFITYIPYAHSPKVNVSEQSNPTPKFLLAGDLAIAHGTAEEFVKTSAKEFTYISSWTAVLRRTDTGWKLVRSHVTMDPFRNSIVTFLQKKSSLTYGLTALVAGLTLGLLLGTVFRRRTSVAS